MPPTDRRGDNGPLLLAVPVALVLYRFRVRPIRFALGAFVILVPGQLVPPESLLAQERSFFGVHRVMIGGNGRIQVLTHGTTIHGAQHREPTRWREPLTYYHRDGPLGQFFEHYDKRGQFDHIGAIGLGAGSLVCYRRSPQVAMTFFEIDLQVVRIATNSRYFRFFDQCGSGVKLVVGDGRRSLREVPDAHFDLLVLDAFSSDAIPVHLLTREALALYFSKLTGPGVLLVHISNRHLNLAPVVAALVADARLAGRVQHYEAGPEDEGFEWGSSWVAIARTETELAPREGDPRWVALPPVAGSRPWTDDYSNIVDALDWRRLIGG